jgi:hypothetical protein
MITILNLQDWLAFRIADLTKGQQMPTTWIPKQVADFPIAFVAPRPPSELQGAVPRLEISLPDMTRGTISISTNETELSGRVLPVDNEQLLLVEGHRVTIDDQGRFHDTLHLVPGTNRVVVTAVGRNEMVQSMIISIEHGDKGAIAGAVHLMRVAPSAREVGACTFTSTAHESCASKDTLH